MNSIQRITKRYAEDMATRQVGTCGFCGKEFRVQQDKLVLHGYKRPGTGETVGRCPGANLAPYELSPETAQLGVDYYKKEVEWSEKQLRQARANPLSITVDTGVVDRTDGRMKVVRKMIPITEWVQKEYPHYDGPLREEILKKASRPRNRGD